MFRCKMAARKMGINGALVFTAIMSSSISTTSQALPSQVKVVPLREVALLSVQHGHGVTATRAPLEAIFQPITQTDPMLMEIGWVDANALDDPAVRNEVAIMFDNGMAIFISRDDPSISSDIISKLFGASSDVEAAIYRRDSEGRLEILAAEPLPGNNSALVKATRIAEALAHRITEEKQGALSLKNAHLQPFSAKHSSLAFKMKDGIPVEVPRQTARVIVYGPNGASITQDVTILRDSSISRDVKKIIATSKYNAPASLYGFQAGYLQIPTMYRLTQSLLAPGTQPVLTEQYPDSDGRTEIDLSSSRATKTSYGFGLSAERSAGLQGKVPSVSAKAGFSFNFAKEYTEEKIIKFSLKDYYVAKFGSFANPISYSYWEVSMAPFIRDKPDYFGSSPTTDRVTPLMQHFGGDTFTVWEVPGEFRNPLTISSNYAIRYARFGKNKGLPPDLFNGPKAQVSIQADSPYLESEITVMLRSASGGGCLNSATNSLTECLADNISLHWNFDAENRYRARRNQQCLTVVPGNRVNLEPCNLATTQKFIWVADRIHSLRDGDDTTLRLHADGTTIRYEKSTAQAFPVNPFDHLLNPWSSYPRAPQATDFVPDIEVRLPQKIPSDWPELYKAALANERWEVIVLREGI
ncbi:RICIN domain-containing protein [Dyella sp.]|uniref:RICIN domain-containing protein n=1 Tax=Dyella sp. TaxID=1869338 RepID=UPI002ED429AF